MIRNRLYYRIKPLLPSTIRMGIRRWLALKKRERVLDSWPILPGSEKTPENWSGWPDGKKFAFVLTHDVEGPSGLAKCRELMKLEMELGFRSSFNFIPEGPYSVTRELRDELTQNGFEVGVHDLHHDGKLYRSRQDFARKAARINRHLKEWGAVGFRSGFMLRKLDWLHDLDVAYDGSSFDTDPFEPQPDGVGTIFPFWVLYPGNSKLKIQNSKLNGGYVELPYTLPQDSTLFLLFRERHPDIWFQKLDWIASKGGMALLNVHPDYVRFNGEPASSRTYPVEYYIRFLKYVRDTYADQFWNALPRDVARHVSQMQSLPVRRRSLRVCMVTHSHYARDNRVIRYAESLAARGDEVDVLSLRPTPGAPDREQVNNVNVFHLQNRFSKTQGGAFGYLWPILRFFFKSSVWITRNHGERQYDIFHIHNIPDFLVFAAWYPRLRGAKIILDIHDVVPEFFASKFSKKEKSKTSRGLLLMEKWSARFAHRVIIANHLWLEKYATRTGANGKCSVFINNVDTNIFRPRHRTRKDDKFIIIFPGGLQWHQGLDIAIRAFGKIKDQLPNAEFHIYGDGNMKEQWITLAREMGLEKKVQFFKPRSVREIAEVMANADLGVVPKRADSFGNEAYSTKIMEFMSLGVPAVVSNTKIDRFYFDDSVVRFFESGNSDALAEAILEVLKNDELRRRMISDALAYADENSWESRKADYLELVDSLIENRSAHSNGPLDRSPTSTRSAIRESELAVK